MKLSYQCSTQPLEPRLTSVFSYTCNVKHETKPNTSVHTRGYEFKALTSIYPVTNLVELTRINNATSEEITRTFAQSWLTRYPWPTRCVHDNGGEFIGWGFQELLAKCNIKDVSTTSCNPTANSVCKRMHQTVGNILRTLLLEDPPITVIAVNDLI